MIVIPAIDLLDNQCVRLKQGNYEEVTVYSEEPYKIANHFFREGADYIHVVDLNGADQDVLTNRESIEEIIENRNVKIQVGGGVRTLERAEELLELGVSRVIIGTVAVENEDLLKQLIATYGNRIVVGVDAKSGKVATRGWKDVSHIEAIDFCKNLEQMGVTTIIYTDISRDGMLSGPNMKVYKELLSQTSLNLIASGGVSTLSDLMDLKAIGVSAAIVGKALYEKKFTLKEAKSCLQNE